MSVNIQTSSGLVKIAGTPTIDTALSNVSKNPVQNKVITEKFDEINSEVDEINSNLNSEISRAKEADEILKSRIDNITSLTEGSTTGDAELQDIRVKADGTTATSAGNAVREQFSELKGDLVDLDKALCEYTELNNLYTRIGNTDNVFVQNSTGNLIGHNDFQATDYIDISGAEYVTMLNCQQGAFFDSNRIYISGFNGGKYVEYKVPENARYIRVSLYKRTTISELISFEIYPVSKLSYEHEKALHESQTNNRLNDFFEIFKLPNRNRFILGDSKFGYIINGSGSEFGNDEYLYSDYIDISDLDTMVIYGVYSVEFYNESKTYVSGGIYGLNGCDETVIMRPVLAKYIRICIPRNKMLYAFLLPNSKVRNLFIPDKATLHKFISYSSGEEGDHFDYAVTDYINISNSEVFVTKGTAQFAYYDENKNYISGVSVSCKDFTEFKKPNNASYVRFSIERTYSNKGQYYGNLAFFMNNDIEICACSLKEKKYSDIFEKSSENKIFYCRKSGNSHFRKLSSALLYMTNIKNGTLYVEDGVYDIKAELGDRFFSSYSYNEIEGLPLCNNNKYILSSNTHVVFDYSNGSNSAVSGQFTPFSSAFSWNPSYYLEGGLVEVNNCRYCIHDDVWYAENYNHTIKNVTMINHGSGSYTQCIGGGLGWSGNICIEGCRLTSDTGDFALSYHNSPGSPTDTKSKLTIKDCYVFGEKTMLFSNLGNSDLVSDILISNTSVYGEITTQASSDDYGKTNISVVQFNIDDRSLMN